MNFVQIFRILRARRLLILMATLSSLAGGLVVLQQQPSRYVASTRVVLDVIKPDPVTGQLFPTDFIDAYIGTQVRMIRDFQVAGRVVEDMGWSQNPDFIAAYSARPTNDTRDFVHWAAQRISAGTSAALQPDSNILEIRYVSTSPELSRAVAESLRKSYIDASVAARRDSAEEKAAWFEKQSEKARERLVELQAKQAAAQKESGISLSGGQDVDNLQLNALNKSVPVIPRVSSAPASKPAALALRQADADIALATKTLGPNNPRLQALLVRRAVLAQQAAAEVATNNAPAGIPGVATARLLESQKGKIIDQQIDRLVLQQLRDEIKMAQEQRDYAQQRAIDLVQQADTSQSGITPLGETFAPHTATYPNKPLIIIGSAALGLICGALVAFLMEMFGRRVRGVEDVTNLGVEIVGAIPVYGERKRRSSPAVESFKRPLWRRGQRAA